MPQKWNDGKKQSRRLEKDLHHGGIFLVSWEMLYYQNEIYGNSYDMYNLCFTGVNSIYSFSYASPISSREDGKAIFESLTDSLELEAEAVE